jgi:hypothetical protein
MIKKLFIPALVLTALLLIASGPVQADGNWVTPANLSNSTVDTTAADIAVDGSGHVHVVWSEVGEIRHRVNTGSGWTVPTIIAAGTLPNLTAGPGPSSLHLTFVNRFGGHDNIYYTSWQNPGWQLPVNVSDTENPSSQPALAVASDGELAIVWREQLSASNRIYVARSDDGSRWSSGPLPNAQGAHPVVTFYASGAPLVAWQDALDVGLPLDIFVSQWREGSWSLPLAVSDSPLVDSSQPAITVGGHGATLAWQEDESAGSRIYTADLTEAGWDSPTQRSNAPDAFDPAVGIAASGQGHLAWITNSDVRYQSWMPTTDTWQPIETIVSGQADFGRIKVAAQDKAHVIWLTGGANRDLYYSTMRAPVPMPHEIRLPLLFS